MVLAGASWWVTHSAIFEARRIVVDGNEHLSSAEVLRLAGVSSRTNVLWLSTSAIERRLEGDPWIQGASVSRTLPSKISISVTERRPVAMIRSGGRRYVVAADSTVVALASGSVRLPVIDFPPRRVHPGARATWAVGPLRAIQALPSNLRVRIRLAVLDRNGQLVLVLRNGIRVIYGEPTQPEAKAAALAVILRWAAGRGLALSYVDVRSPITPAAGPAVAATPVPGGSTPQNVRLPAGPEKR